MTVTTGPSDGDQYTFYLIYRTVALRMGNVFGKRNTESQKTFYVQ